MSEDVTQGLVMLTRLLEIFGASILVLGFIYATVQWFSKYHQHGGTHAVEHYRRALGRVIVIGLELLVAATIIKTVTIEQTVEGIGLLVFMIAIRTVLSWTTVLEMSGRWPWQRPRPDAAKSRSTS
jgi:uncharacterized membrane protein